jgi:hypothetical protein
MELIPHLKLKEAKHTPDDLTIRLPQGAGGGALTRSHPSADSLSSYFDSKLVLVDSASSTHGQHFQGKEVNNLNGRGKLVLHMLPLYLMKLCMTFLVVWLQVHRKSRLSLWTSWITLQLWAGMARSAELHVGYQDGTLCSSYT